jgi:hypothetical protein
LGKRYQVTRKKLIEAARYWAGGDKKGQSVRIDQDVIDGLKMANAPQEVIDQALLHASADAPQDLEIDPRNWLSVTLFFSISTQWMISDSGQHIGIRYESLESSMNMCNINQRRRPAVFEDIRIMEGEALRILRENYVSAG